MARITIRAVPHVALDALVLRICLGLRMAIRADEGRIVRGVGMAIAALSVVMRKRKQGVVKSRAAPASRSVTRGASGRETGSLVVRIRCCQVFRLMTRIAVRWCAREPVADMAAQTGHSDVRASQRKSRKAGVVESCRLPGHCGVADGTIRRENGSDVAGICRSLKILDMAAIAVCRRPLEFPTNVAGGAIQRGVDSAEGKPSEPGVIEARAKPGVCAVTELAGC